MKTKNTSRNLYVRGNTVNPFAAAGPDKAGNERYWRWGSDNLFPNALALMSRRSPTHRRIINDKADYISGKGFTCDPERRTLAAIAERANGAGESLRVILNKLAFDKSLFGNAFLEIATDPDETSLSLFHQDASRCRVARDGTHILLHHDWTAFTLQQAKSLPLYPVFEPAPDGTLRSIVHYKDYEPMFEHYGLPAERIGDRLQDRPMEHQPVGQLVPTVGYHGAGRRRG